MTDDHAYIRGVGPVFTGRCSCGWQSRSEAPTDEFAYGDWSDHFFDVYFGVVR